MNQKTIKIQATKMESNNLVQTFSFQSTNVRVIAVKDEHWFVLGDVLAAIASSTPVTVAVNAVIKALGEGFNDVKPLKTSGGSQNVIIVHEAAVTTLISRSETEMGRAFNRHLHAVILPTIRKTGKFIAHPEIESDHNLAIRKLDLQIDIKKLELAKLELQRNDLEPQSIKPIQTELDLGIEQRYNKSKAALLAAKTLENEAKAQALTQKFAIKQKQALASRVNTESIAAWANECIVLKPTAIAYIGNATGNPKTHLYPNYVNYCNQHHLEIVNMQAFSRALAAFVQTTLNTRLGKSRDRIGCHLIGIAIAA
jgi:prophage antirepressor-like protein